MNRQRYLKGISKYFFLIFIMLLCVLFCHSKFLLAATTSGILSMDETWTGIITITGDVTVPSGITLTIEPGATVQFLPNEGLELIIEGTLQAVGTQSQPITFTSQAGDPLPGDWTWIYFSEGSQGQLDHCRIFHSNTGIRAKMCSPVITNSRLEENLFGLNLSRSNARITQNIISQNGIGITADYCQAQITHNHICQNTYEGIVLGHASSDTLLHNNLIYDNGGYGLILEYSSMAPIINNTVFRNQKDGILLKKESITKVCNNIISHNQGFGISCWQSSWPVIFYNDLWSNTGRNYYDYATGGGYAPLPGVGEISEDPLYMDETLPDLHLRTESVAIDAGNPASPYNQEPLPNGGRINMGAYGNTQEAALSCETQCTIRIAQNILGTTGASIVIPVSIETAQSVTGIENLVIRYVSTILEPTDISVTGLGQGLNLASNLTTPGEIRISAFDAGQAPIQGTGDLFEVTFNITGSPGSTTPLDLISVKRVLGEEDLPVCTQLEDGDFTILGEVSISGTITYYNDSSPVPGVNIALSGSGTYETTSTQTGQYVLTGIPDGLDYTLTPIKEEDTEGCIGIYDAILIARQTVGLESFGTYQSMAADVNGNNESDIGDAIKIARYTVGLESLPFAPGRVWEFIPDQIGYTPLVGNQESQDFIGLIYGDVDGDWAQGTMRTRKRTIDELSEQDGLISLSLPQETKGKENESITVPISISNIDRFFGSEDLIIDYSPGILEALAVDKTNLTSNATIITNLGIPGQIRISFFCLEPVSGEGDILEIRFMVTGKAGESTPLDLLSINRLIGKNNKSIPVELIDGLFIVEQNQPEDKHIERNYGSDQIITVEIPLYPGWNCVGPVVDLGAYKASDLCLGINIDNQEDICEEISRFAFGTLESHICGYPFNDFDIFYGMGYLIKSSDFGTWVQAGQNIPSPLEIVLNPGWNLISIPLWAEGSYDAQGLMDLINDQLLEQCCIEISRSWGSAWQTHYDGLPCNNFPIVPGECYLLKMTKEITLIIENLE